MDNKTDATASAASTKEDARTLFDASSDDSDDFVLLFILIAIVLLLLFMFIGKNNEIVIINYDGFCNDIYYKEFYFKHLQDKILGYDRYSWSNNHNFI